MKEREKRVSLRERLFPPPIQGLVLQIDPPEKGKIESIKIIRLPRTVVEAFEKEQGIEKHLVVPTQMRVEITLPAPFRKGRIRFIKKLPLYKKNEL